MAHYTQISISEMREVLRATSGWQEVSAEVLAQDGTKEHVFEWSVKEIGQPIKVYTSILLATGLTRKVGADAIRVCVPKWRKSDRVHRVEGWRDNLIAAVRVALQDVRERATHKAAPAPVLTPAPEQPTYSGINSVFAKATQSKLKRPKVRFTIDGTTVQLVLCGEKSKYVGQVGVTDGGGFGASQWFGVINNAGVWSKGKAVTPAVTKIVDEFNADPAGFGAAYGKKSGQCCFCSRHLETEESLTVGYGPICAVKFGLPWGHVSKEVA